MCLRHISDFLTADATNDVLSSVNVLSFNLNFIFDTILRF